MIEQRPDHRFKFPLTRRNESTISFKLEGQISGQSAEKGLPARNFRLRKRGRSDRAAGHPTVGAKGHLLPLIPRAGASCR
jgi:hypothetical protein